MLAHKIPRLIVVLVFACGCAKDEAITLPTGPIVIEDAAAELKFPDEKTAEHYQPYLTPERDFRRFGPLAEGVRKCTDVTLYEGLPHDWFEAKLFSSELGTKETFRIDGCDFYKRPLVLSDDASRELTAIFCTPRLFSPNRPLKSCGGFHADYGIQWSDGENTYQALVCFGCGEVRWIGPETSLEMDIANKRLGQVLKSYRGQRPGHGVR